MLARGRDPPPHEGEPSVSLRHISPFVTVERDRRTVRYSGRAAHESDWGVVRAQDPCASGIVLAYFEVDILSHGDIECVFGPALRDAQPGSTGGVCGL